MTDLSQVRPERFTMTGLDEVVFYPAPVPPVPPKAGRRPTPSPSSSQEDEGDEEEGLAGNVFCPTGPGGGVDPKCSPGEGRGDASPLEDLDPDLRSDVESYVASKAYLSPDNPNLSPLQRKHLASDRRAVEVHRAAHGIVSKRPTGAQWEDDTRVRVEEKAVELLRKQGKDADLGFATRGRSAGFTDVNDRAEPVAIVQPAGGRGCPGGLRTGPGGGPGHGEAG